MALDDQFARVFDGHATSADLHQMISDYGCRVVVITPNDGAWDHDPFAASGLFRLAEDKDDQWRIYVATGLGPPLLPHR